MRSVGLLVWSLMVSSTAAFAGLRHSSVLRPASCTVLSAEAGVSRREALGSALAVGLVLPWGKTAASAAEEGVTKGGVKYKVQAPGKSAYRARVGDLVAIRFRGQYKDSVFDDILDNTEPFYFRLGSGAVLKGIEDAVQEMPVGAKWELEIPGDLAFGSAGRGASPGKPRIPPGATINYILELSGIPGREEDLIDVIGD